MPFKNIEERRRYNRKYRQEHLDKERKYRRDYYKENRDRIRLYQKIKNSDKKYKQMKRKAYSKAKKEGRTKKWYDTFIAKHGSAYYAVEKSPFYQSVVLETNHKFKRDNKCALCGNTERLQFHHWIYKLPVERKHFSTLCRDCHQMIHGRVFNKQSQESIL